jgi:ADP-ribose pyrophosphatase YjhB (NUDIX family)
MGVMHLKIRVGGIITGPDGLLLMRYRHGGGDVYCIPGGGVDDGEWLDCALIREFQEELDVSVSVGPILALAQGGPMGNKVPTLHVIFSCTITGGIPHLNPEETSANEVCWIPLDELDGLVLYPDVKGIIKTSLRFSDTTDTPKTLSDLEIPYVKLPVRRWL